MSMRGYILSVTLMIAVLTSCKQREPVLVQVLRDPHAQFAEPLGRTTYQFALLRPHLADGQDIMVGTFEGEHASAADPQWLLEWKPQMVIVKSQADLWSEITVTTQLGNPEPICGAMVAYIPVWVSGQKREATEMYLHFLQSHCN
jgi:hypothetical protein